MTKIFFSFFCFVLFPQLQQVVRKKSKQEKRAAKKAEEEFLYKVLDACLVLLILTSDINLSSQLLGL